MIQQNQRYQPFYPHVLLPFLKAGDYITHNATEPQSQEVIYKIIEASGATETFMILYFFFSCQHTNLVEMVMVFQRDESASKPETAVQDRVSTFGSLRHHNSFIFKSTNQNIISTNSSWCVSGSGELLFMKSLTGSS